MRKKSIMTVLALSMSCSMAMASFTEKVTISDGTSVTETVKQLSFDGDKVILTFENGSQLAVDDLSKLSITLIYEATGINTATADVKKTPEGIYTLDGQKANAGNLKKGKIYIIDGRKTLVK